MTPLPRAPAPRGIGAPPRSRVATGLTGRHRGIPRLARALLHTSAAMFATLSVLPLSSCLPPDFEIVPQENHPIAIEKALLTRSPDQFHDMTFDCEPRVFDLSNAIVDADPDDPITIAWIVDYAPGLSVEPDAINRLRFTFDKCTNPKAELFKITTIEALVLDRVVPLEILADIDQLKAFDGDGVTQASVVWFVGFDSYGSCCE